MKHHLLLLALLCTLFAQAQDQTQYTEQELLQISTDWDMIRVSLQQPAPVSTPGEGVKVSDEFFSRKGLPNDTCGPDTVEYPLYGKSSALQLWQIDGTGYLGFGQYYDAPQDIVVHGIKFYGHVQDNAQNSDTVDVWVKLYDASPVDSMPMGAALDSVQVAVVKAWDNNNIENGAYRAIFDNPVTVNSAYFVSLEHTGADTVLTISNSVTNSDGAGENLGFYNFSNVWYRNIDFISFDADWILHPIVSYEYIADFSLSTDSACLPNQGGFDTLCTTNLVSPIAGNRMYNQNAANPEYAWDWGNGLTGFAVSPCETYDSPGDYVVTATDTMVGWQTQCVSVQTADYNLIQAPFSTYTFDDSANPLVVFTNTSSNGVTYLWDFGDGNSSTDEDPTHTYATAGTYEVWLYAMNACGIDSSSQAVFITVGIEEELLGEQLSVYPNPSEGQFNMTYSGTAMLTVEVYNAIGDIIATATLQGASTIDLSAYPAGNYWFRFSTDEVSVTRQVQVVR